MKYVKNDSGLTLLEVLASIVILSIVIVSFMSFFPNMAIFNENTKNNLDAVTIAKELLVEIKPLEYTDIVENTYAILSTDPYPSAKLTIDSELSSNGYLVLRGEHRENKIVVTINRNEETLQTANLNKHEIKIEVFESDQKTLPSSTIYGYIRH